MSEYFSIEAEATDDGDVMILWVNQALSATTETYATPDEGEGGSPIAQLLFLDVGGIMALTIQADALIVRRADGVVWEALIDEIRDALRDFFL